MRYLVALGSMSLLGLRFPYGTLAVNLAGSFALTLLVQAVPSTQGASPELKLFLGTGVLGGFTTYSTFNGEVLAMLHGGDHARAALYVALTLAGCLGAGALGWIAGSALR